MKVREDPGLTMPSKTSFDAYIVVDVEATCDERPRLRREEMEIIEIGAVRVRS